MNMIIEFRTEDISGWTRFDQHIYRATCYYNHHYLKKCKEGEETFDFLCKSEMIALAC